MQQKGAEPTHQERSKGALVVDKVECIVEGVRIREDILPPGRQGENDYSHTCTKQSHKQMPT